MSATVEKSKPAALLQVTLPLADWQHVLNAVESSLQRKKKRGDKRGADERAVMIEAILTQCQAGLLKLQGEKKCQ